MDEKIKFWDTRQGKSLLFSIDGGTAVRCITVSGNSLVVCVEASMHIYDLRNLDQPFQSYASQVEVPIRCVTSVPHSKGNHIISRICDFSGNVYISTEESLLMHSPGSRVEVGLISEISCY